MTYGIIVEKDVDVPMRDGARLKADVVRPDDPGKFPAILNLGPYQKDKLWIVPDTLEEKPNPLMNWETINPQWWVPRGYVAVRVDGRGSGKSPGQCEPWSLAESIDFHDAIEWAAAQPWCSGKVGLCGISYYAINQWFVANHQPPSLQAIIPWEGFADLYRDALFHGNWSGMALHLRGNTEAFMRAASPHKKLRIHAGTHVHPFYSEDGRRDQLRFFDYWLKGIENGVMDEPPVKLAIRKGHDEIEWRYEHEWPLKRTQWTRFYLDLSSCKSNADPGVLADGNPAVAGACSYPATALGSMGSTSAASSQVMGGGIAPGMGVSLATPPLAHDMEATGPVAAVLWVSSSTEDMDLFLTIRNIDGDGKEVLETGQQGTPVPVAKGWLRVSHRELDPRLSLPYRPYRPYHKHQQRQYLEPGEVVRVEVEIWPTSMVFRKGHRIRLDISPRDGVGSASYMHYHADYNSGTNTIHAGGERESYLLLPIIPPA